MVTPAHRRYSNTHTMRRANTQHLQYVCHILCMSKCSRETSSNRAQNIPCHMWAKTSLDFSPLKWQQNHCFSLVFSLPKAFMYHMLVKQINALAVGEIILIKCRKYWSIFPLHGQSAVMAGFQDRNNRFYFDLCSMELSPPKGLPGLNSDLQTVTCSRLWVCGVIKKKYCFIKAQCAAAMTPVNADRC